MGRGNGERGGASLLYGSFSRREAGERGKRVDAARDLALLRYTFLIETSEGRYRYRSGLSASEMADHYGGSLFDDEAMRSSKLDEIVLGMQALVDAGYAKPLDLHGRPVHVETSGAGLRQHIILTEAGIAEGQRLNEEADRIQRNR